MANLIRLEVASVAEYDTATGKPIMKSTTDYVCSGCRHIVKGDDIHCWQCGERLEQPELVECHYGGENLAEEEYKKLNP